MIRHTSHLGIALTTFMVLFATACSTEVPGTPSTTQNQSGSVPSGTTAPGQQAPAVPKALDATKYLAAPCATLGPDQLDSFKAQGSGEAGEKDGNPTCTWRFGANGDARADVAYMKSVGNGLNNLYALDASGWWNNGYFDPTTVDQYPGVFHDTTDHRSSGICGLGVSITGSLYFSVLIQAQTGNDACIAAKNVASAVVETLKKGA